MTVWSATDLRWLDLGWCTLIPPPCHSVGFYGILSNSFFLCATLPWAADAICGTSLEGVARIYNLLCPCTGETLKQRRP
ncbi:hypothetical protein An08g05980 [Aspergillus niger]|uniref:Uncharacterized protein n=2 Tax=Aspergillus niger TaxID=5061 RepID=A2QRG9_ASPNC|nr:hypothetical protein An08g05980 [Aspergillus niger]CAK45570.1 hypothetical protein An08g05980 [Aspergillus niger]